jgi:hypothetical protein
VAALPGISCHKRAAKDALANPGAWDRKELAGSQIGAPRPALQWNWA